MAQFIPPCCAGIDHVDVPCFVFSGGQSQSLVFLQALLEDTCVITPMVRIWRQQTQVNESLLTDFNSLFCLVQNFVVRKGPYGWQQVVC